MTATSFRTSVAAFSIALIAACSSVPTELVLPEHAPVLAPVTLDEFHQAQQILRAAFLDREISLRGVVQEQPSNLSVVLLTATGQRLLSVAYDGSDWKVDKPSFMPVAFRPEQVISDLELALWPLAKLQAAYPAAWSLTDAGGGVRRLRHDGKLFAEVHYADGDATVAHWQGRSWISNFRYGYSLAIESTPL